MATDVSNERRLSRYAQKKREEALGLRTPFAFKDSKEEKGGNHSVVVIKAQVAEPDPNEERRVVDAKVVRIKRHFNCAFLETDQGEEIFLSLHLLRRNLGEDISVDVGWMVRCIVKENKDFPGVSARYVLSATSS